MPFQEVRRCEYKLCYAVFIAQTSHHRFCCSQHKDAQRRLSQTVEGVRDGVHEVGGGEGDTGVDGPARLRVLFFDIETAPMLAYIWQAKTEYVGTHQITHETFLISWAAKWADEDEVFGDVLTPDEATAQEDGRVVASLANAIREADIVVAHNGDRFDVPMLNNRLLLLGLEPVGSVKVIDTLTLARKSFRLASNKLDHLARHLGLDTKIETTFDLWKQCYAGDPEALDAMYEYNVQDVYVLQAVYERMAPYVKGLPRLVEGRDDGTLECPYCAGPVERDGFHLTNASTFPRWRCRQCRRHARGRSAIRQKRLELLPLR